MTLEKKIERSRRSERIKFFEIGCGMQADPLVAIQDSAKIKAWPVWLLRGDLEGKRYADYISNHLAYTQIYVRAGLLQRLEKAAAALPDNLELVVRAGHRPIEVQRQVLHGFAEAYKRNRPEATDKQALAHARIFVSDPDIKLPPHCCGAAVDVELYDAQKQQLVDFGSPLNMDDEISYLHSDKVTARQKQNRMQLLTVMLDAGFSSYHAEWWHFSYGDEMWAWFYGSKNSLYGLIEV